MAYPVENEQELLDIVKQPSAERASFAVIMEGEKWKETTLALPNEIPESSRTNCPGCLMVWHVRPGGCVIPTEVYFPSLCLGADAL